jgi:hypothetical protein
VGGEGEGEREGESDWYFAFHSASPYPTLGEFTRGCPKAVNTTMSKTMHP